MADKADVILFDPIAATRSLDENSNSHIDVLKGGQWRIVAATRVALTIAYHTAKDAARDMKAAGGRPPRRWSFSYST